MHHKIIEFKFKVAYIYLHYKLSYDKDSGPSYNDQRNSLKFNDKSQDDTKEFLEFYKVNLDEIWFNKLDLQGI